MKRFACVVAGVALVALAACSSGSQSAADTGSAMKSATPAATDTAMAADSMAKDTGLKMSPAKQ